MFTFTIDCVRTDCPHGVTSGRLLWDENDIVVGVRGACGHVSLTLADD